MTAPYCCEWNARGAAHDPECIHAPHRYLPCRDDDEVPASERCGECGGTREDDAHLPVSTGRA